jgi:hypothetical protein
MKDAKTVVGGEPIKTLKLVRERVALLGVRSGVRTGGLPVVDGNGDGDCHKTSHPTSKEG